ncbi:MAG: TonB family protein [Acidobacteriota bacterium]
METLDLPDIAHTDAEPELHLLLAENHADDWRRRRAAAIGSGIFHLVLIVVLLTVKESPYVPPPPERLLVRHVTPLYTPPELTQKAPNKTPLSKELTVESIAPRPVFKAPAPAPSAKRAEPVKAAPVPPAPPPQQVTQTPPKLVELEAPKIEAPASAQTAQLPKAGQLPPQPQEAPKLALQDVNPAQRPGNAKPTGLIQVPAPGIQEAVRNLSHNGGAQGGMSVGDLGADEGGSGPGLNLPPSAGRPKSSLELKSDPMGVDFRPYMLQVIAAVRRNWFAVYPEAARLGQRGQVVLQFAVVKQGLVTKVVFNGQSGAKALDQSAVAAISASNPLPPLPPEFKGDRIVLQMTFLYNMPR